MAPVLLIVLAAGLGEAGSEPRSEPRGLPPQPPPVQLGVRLVETTAQLRDALGVGAERGALVMEADPAGPAARAGIAAGDVLTRVAGKPVGNGGDVLVALEGRKAGEEIAVEYVRTASVHSARVTLAAAPPRTGRAPFEFPGGESAERFRSGLRRFHDEIDRRLREMERRLRRLEDGEQPERTARDLPGA